MAFAGLCLGRNRGNKKWEKVAKSDVCSVNHVWIDFMAWENVRNLTVMVEVSKCQTESRQIMLKVRLAVRPHKTNCFFVYIIFDRLISPLHASSPCKHVK